MGCKSCREAGSLGAIGTGKLRYTFPNDWQNCRADPNGNNEKQIKSLTKKTNEHSVSHRHKIAETLKSSFFKTS